MRIPEVKNVSFSGRLKHGDLLKKLNSLNEAAKLKGAQIYHKSDVSAEASLYKIFDNPDHLTSKDNSKILASGSSGATSILGSSSSSFAESMDTWSVFSIF